MLTGRSVGNHRFAVEDVDTVPLAVKVRFLREGEMPTQSEEDWTME